MRRLAVALAALTLVAACGPSAHHHPRSSLQSPAGRLIRDWLMALQRRDYGQAATFFAPGAVVYEGRAFRLGSRAERRFFNATLPCLADLIALKDEGGGNVLATFRLRAGPRGACDGLSRIRYRIARGRFTEYRLLRPPGPEA